MRKFDLPQKIVTDGHWICVPGYLEETCVGLVYSSYRKNLSVLSPTQNTVSERMTGPVVMLTGFLD